jgi:hypothetical protein
MKTYIQEKNGYQLEIGLGWFSVYDTVEGIVISTGMSINFGGSHDEMRKFAIAVFDKLIK